MTDSLWSDRRFRSFLASLRGGGIFGSDVDDAERDEFIRQAQIRLAPEVSRRVLAHVGATVDDYGVALVAFDVLEQSAWESPRAWLVTTTDPWTLLGEMVTGEITESYRSTVAARGDDESELAGILAASTRPAIGTGGEEHTD